ncbi:MAG: 1-(5-phosphoribosyl)-5-((5-phosphoribosylamino)methylideneamino)imidazole-4-carboxamide isomerase [Sulfolobales archaeon]
MKIVPSIDLSSGKAVKRVKGVRGSELVVGDPIKVGEKLYELGYEALHIVDLDAAEGHGDNEDVVKVLTTLGFKWVQVGGGIRNCMKAQRLLSYGASSIVISTMFYENRRLFEELVSLVGGEKILIAVDYDENLIVRTRGWVGRGVHVDEALNDVNNYNVLGVVFTYIGSEGTVGGVDRKIQNLVVRVRGLKEYAGGISGLDDLRFLKEVGIDYAIVGMAIYRGSLVGVKYV